MNCEMLCDKKVGPPTATNKCNNKDETDNDYKVAAQNVFLIM